MRLMLLLLLLLLVMRPPLSVSRRCRVTLYRPAQGVLKSHELHALVQCRE